MFTSLIAWYDNMAKSVTFRKDEDCEMLEVYIGGEHWRTGNYWDFNFVEDLPEILDALGVANFQEDFSYEDEEE